MNTIVLGTIKYFFSVENSFQNVKCEPSWYITCHCLDLQLRKVGCWGSGIEGYCTSSRLPQCHYIERSWSWNWSIRSQYWRFCLTNDSVIIFADAFLIPQQTSVILLSLFETHTMELYTFCIQVHSLFTGKRIHTSDSFHNKHQ